MIRTAWLALASFVVLTVFWFAPTVAGQADQTNVGFIGTYKVQAEKTDPSTLPIIGAWKINLTKSDPGLAGRFQPTSLNLFIAENGGIRQEVFQDYPPQVNNYTTVMNQRYRSFWDKLDGQNIYKDPQGPNGQGQTVAMWLVDRNTLFRERATKGVVDEWVMYRVSPDGKTLVWTPFNAKGNSGQMVWDKVEMPSRTN